MKRRSVCRATMLAALCQCSLSAAGSAATVSDPASEWRFLGNDVGEQHFSPLMQIDVESVTRLGLAWYADLPAADGATGVPLVAGGVVYQSGALGLVFANDVRTGQLKWTFDPHLR